MAFVRKYWIVGLVILLVATHAVVIGYVRSEATRLKTVAASEIPIGLFYKQSQDRQWLTQLRVHLQVPPERRLVARATIEHNRWVVHEAVEETLRRLDESLFQDPALVAVKEEIKVAIDEVLHEAIVEKIVINDRVDLDVREFRWRPSQELIMPGEESQAAKTSTLTSVRPIRPTLSEQNEHAEAKSTPKANMANTERKITLKDMATVDTATVDMAKSRLRVDTPPNQRHLATPNLLLPAMPSQPRPAMPNQLRNRLTQQSPARDMALPKRLSPQVTKPLVAGRASVQRTRAYGRHRT